MSFPFTVQLVQLILDQCGGVPVKEMEGVGGEAQQIDESDCKAAGETPGNQRYDITWREISLCTLSASFPFLFIAHPIFPLFFFSLICARSFSQVFKRVPASSARRSEGNVSLPPLPKFYRMHPKPGR